jgi:plastocyanin
MKPFAVALVLVLVASLLACGSKREPKTHQIQIRGMEFVPAKLDVAVGDTVVWTNTDVLPHTVTSSIPSAATFDSRSIESKQTWQLEITNAGEHAYVCTYHPTMRATLVAR